MKIEIYQIKIYAAQGCVVWYLKDGKSNLIQVGRPKGDAFIYTVSNNNSEVRAYPSNVLVHLETRLKELLKIVERRETYPAVIGQLLIETTSPTITPERKREIFRYILSNLRPVQTVEEYHGSI
jgi:hypothetical protein